MPIVNAHLNELPVKFSVCVSEDQDKLPSTMYWLPKHHERPYKARLYLYFIANSNDIFFTLLHLQTASNC